MKNKIVDLWKRVVEYAKKNPFVVSISGIVIITIIVMIIVVSVTYDHQAQPAANNQAVASGTIGSTSMTQEELDKLSFSLTNTSQEDIDKAVEYVTAQIDIEAAKPYIVTFEKGNIYASEEATVFFRKSFFLSDYVERYKLTDTYVNTNTIAVLAEYTVDYDEAQVPYAEGKITRAYYLLKNSETKQWTTWKEETVSAE